MNFLPLILNVFLPWGVYCICCGLTSFSLMYERPKLVAVLIAAVFALWLACVHQAYWARRNNPDPTWYTYAAVAIGIAFFSGISSGLQNFNGQGAEYKQISSLKVVHKLDPNTATGLDVLDAGMVYFADNARLDGTRSWHFKQRRLYCVAPIVSNNSRTIDFWAVGRDCCSIDSSDFRCGAWGASNAHTGIRVLDEDVPYYRLAVQQAETLYGIISTHPTFFRWSRDPITEVANMGQAGFKTYRVQASFAFVLCLAGVGIMAFRFAWLGRYSSTYQMHLMGHPGYGHHGQGFCGGIFTRLFGQRPYGHGMYGHGMHGHGPFGGGPYGGGLFGGSGLFGGGGLLGGLFGRGMHGPGFFGQGPHGHMMPGPMMPGPMVPGPMMPGPMMPGHGTPGPGMHGYGSQGFAAI